MPITVQGLAAALLGLTGVLAAPAGLARPPDAPPQAAAADDRLTKAEVGEVADLLDAMMTGSGDYATAEHQARQFYALVAQDFGAESREAVQIERLIVLATALQSRPDEAARLGVQMMDTANRVLMADDPLGYSAASAFALALLLAGYPDEALEMATQALTQAETALPRGTLAIDELRFVQVRAAIGSGELGIADAGFQRLYDSLTGRSDPAAVALRSFALAAWAQFLQDNGDPASALSVYDQALNAIDAQFSTLKYPHMQPVRLRTVALMGETLIQLGRGTAAVQMLRPVLAEVTAHYGADSPFYADIAFVLAVALAGDQAAGPGAAEALALMGQVVAQREAVMDPRAVDLLRARINLAMLLASNGRAGDAVAQLDKMEGAVMPGQRSQQVYVLRMAEESGQLTRAEAISAVLRYLQDSQTSGAAVAQRLLSARLAAGTGPAAALLRTRTDAEARLNLLRTQLAAASALPLPDRDAVAEQALRGQIRAQGDHLAALRRQIADEQPDLARLTDQTSLTLADVQARLGPDAALIVVDPPESANDPGLLVAISATDMDWHTIDATPDELEQAVARLRGQIGLRLGLRSAVALDDQAGDGGEEPQPEVFDQWAAYWLYLKILAPLDGVTRGKSQLYFDLRGVLTALPPQLMITAEPASDDLAKAQWLVRDRAVTILPALSALRAPGAAGLAAGHQVLAFADPHFDAPAAAPAALRGGLAPLPETAAEVAEVAAALGAGADRLRLGAAASEAALKAADLSDVGLLYFATHGLVSGDVVGEGTALDEPALALTPGAGEDGFLTASEIAHLHLNARFVVLSACNTAAGGTPGAQALSGLAQAFLYAGARGLLVSHWPVESRSAVALMTDFFRRLAADPGLGAAEAQRRAIVAMIDHPANPRWSHPAYWAPFILVGQPDG